MRAVRFATDHPRRGETPSTKAQAPKKFQFSKHLAQKKMSEQTARMSVFELGAWCFLGVFSLEFGAFCLGAIKRIAFLLGWK
jgi:hypothetical protein